MPDPVAEHQEQPDAQSVCSTSEAARLLGVSNTTIQIMVERGELQAWKTRGGHRRILTSSIERLKAERESKGARPVDSNLLSILVVEDDPTLRAIYKHTIGQWGHPVNVETVGDGVEALLLLERWRPDVLILDLFMAPMDGFHLLKVLRSHREFNQMVIIVVTGLDQQEVEARGGLPKGILVYRKPVPFEKLEGIIESALISKQLSGR